MLQRLLIPTMTAILTGGLLLPCIRAGESDKTPDALAANPSGARKQTGDLHPFTHRAWIPTGADTGTIRLDKVRLVKVAARMRYTMDACDGLAFREPGGSIGCPDGRVEATTTAFEATYSYTGLPLASDEQGGRRFTFSVRFRPDELTLEAQKALTARKLSRQEASAYFAVTTSREAVTEAAIDKQQSRFCAGYVLDGQWTHTDARCMDVVSNRTVTAPSEYITVQIDPVSPQGEAVGMASAR